LIGKISWGMIFIGFNMLYFTMLVLGWQGMPRRYYDHLDVFHGGHVHATIGSWVLAIGIFLMFANLIYARFKGKKIGANPWGGSTLEWHTPSPPPLENFEEDPVVKEDPYDFEGVQ